MEFMQAYGYLDMICRNLLNNNRGIVAYIERMRAMPDGESRVEGWTADLKQLMECRSFRNLRAHGCPMPEEETRFPELAQWIGVFAGRIISGTDPLTQYNQAT